MEIVIDIDENLYTRLFDNGVDNYDDAVDMAKAIRKGTPLPEKHGRLIDADALLDKKQDYGEGQNTLILIDPYYVRKAPTIIEESEGKG